MSETSDKLDRFLPADPDRKRAGIGMVSAVVMYLAFQIGLPWWHVALVTALIFWGLHMVAGLKVSFW